MGISHSKGKNHWHCSYVMQKLSVWKTGYFHTATPGCSGFSRHTSHTQLLAYLKVVDYIGTTQNAH